MYKIINWNTNEVIAEIASLSAAKRVCRKLGHTSKAWGKHYPPIAYVADDGGLVYNPRFSVGKHDDFKAVPILKPHERPKGEKQTE